MKLFKALLKELQLNKPKYTHFTNKTGKQSSVAVVFRVNRPEASFEKYREEIEGYYCDGVEKADFGCVPPMELLERVLEGMGDGDLEVLLTQRASSTRDVNSGTVWR